MNSTGPKQNPGNLDPELFENPMVFNSSRTNLNKVSALNVFEGDVPQELIGRCFDCENVFF